MDYDLVVIGAGIQGAAVAQAAAAAGYKVLVLEQYSEPAQGTSCRSSKLIHGGLRYLESGQFSLVRECLHERKTLLKTAPDLVKLTPFYIPVYQDTSRPAWKVWLGLVIYFLFSRKKFFRLNKKDWASLDGLVTDGLITVFCYYDAQTDDGALTRSVLQSARSLGAEILFNTSFIGAKINENSCEIKCLELGSEKVILAQALVNATGPWVFETAGKIFPMAAQPDVDLVQGAHIELPGSVEKGMYYLEAPQDQRAVFVMPWRNHLLIGTTESSYEGRPEDVEPLEDEIEYLLTVYNHYFDGKVERSDVINAFAGLRVLPKGTGAAFSRPRDTLLVGNLERSPRVVSLYGGKLTAHRATAEDVMAMLAPVLPQRKAKASTRTLSLPVINM